MATQSPCNGICKLEQNTCIGCGRTIWEIMEWPDADESRRREIVKAARRRVPEPGRLERGPQT